MDKPVETEWKLPIDLKIGDKILAFGWRSVVVKIEMIFHYKPESTARIELKMIDTGEKAVLFIPRGMKIETLK
jgi:hypothetical protein